MIRTVVGKAVEDLPSSQVGQAESGLGDRPVVTRSPASLTWQIELVEAPVVPLPPIVDQHRPTAKTFEDGPEEQQRVEVGAPQRNLDVDHFVACADERRPDVNSRSSTGIFVSSITSVVWSSGRSLNRTASAIRLVDRLIRVATPLAGLAIRQAEMVQIRCLDPLSGRGDFPGNTLRLRARSNMVEHWDHH